MYNQLSMLSEPPLRILAMHYYCCYDCREFGIWCWKQRGKMGMWMMSTAEMERGAGGEEETSCCAACCVMCDVHLESWSRSWGPTNLGHWPCVQYKYWSTRTFVAVLYSVQLKRVQVLRLRVQVLVHTPSTSQNDWRARQSPEYCTWYTVRGYSSTHSVGRMNIL